MHVIDDDRFGVGFEFEFTIADADLILREREFAQVCNLNWAQFKHGFELYGPDKKLPQVEALLSFQEFQNPKKRWEGDLESYGEEFGWARLIVLLGLKPRAQHWYYRNSKGEFLLRTAEIKEAISSVDTCDGDAVKRLSRRLGRYYVRAIELEKYGSMTHEGKKKIFECVVDVLSWRTGHQFKRLTYENDDNAKDTPDWYVADEETNDMRDWSIDVGIEINTPVMTPREALTEYRNISDALLDFPFRVFTGPDSGLHINISHPDIGVDDVSVLEFSLMHDETAMAKPFGRSNNEACELYVKHIRKTIRKLVRDRIISLAVFDRNPTMMMTFIESSLEMRKMSSMNLGSLYKYGFVEYRLPGGAGYLKKHKEVRRHLIELLKIHRGFGTHNMAVQRRLRRLLVAAGADKNDGISLIEMVPETIFKS